jgi:hypothetical protein
MIESDDWCRKHRSQEKQGGKHTVQDHPSPTLGTKPADGRPLTAQERIGPDNQPSLEQGQNRTQFQ